MNLTQYSFWEHQGLFGAKPPINLKAAPATQVVSDIVDVRGRRSFCLVALVAQVGAGTVGQFKVTIASFTKPAGAVADKQLEFLDIYTVVPTNIGAGVTRAATFTFGELQLTGGNNSGTAGANLERTLRSLAFVQFRIEVTTSSDAATSCTATFSLGAS